MIVHMPEHLFRNRIALVSMHELRAEVSEPEPGP